MHSLAQQTGLKHGVSLRGAIEETTGPGHARSRCNLNTGHQACTRSDSARDILLPGLHIFCERETVDRANLSNRTVEWAAGEDHWREECDPRGVCATTPPCGPLTQRRLDPWFLQDAPLGIQAI